MTVALCKSQFEKELATLKVIKDKLASHGGNVSGRLDDQNKSSELLFKEALDQTLAGIVNIKANIVLMLSLTNDNQKIATVFESLLQEASAAEGNEKLIQYNLKLTAYLDSPIENGMRDFKLKPGCAPQEITTNLAQRLKAELDFKEDRAIKGEECEEIVKPLKTALVQSQKTLEAMVAEARVILKQSRLKMAAPMIIGFVLLAAIFAGPYAGMARFNISRIK